jgi:hypothetical protein
MVHELELRGVSKKIGEEFFSKKLILPLLDGLDELATADEEGTKKQEKCIEAINQFCESSMPRYLVVCSRTNAYSNCKNKLFLDGAISLKGLSDQKIKNYLVEVGCEALWEKLRYSKKLLDLLRTPFLLSMAVMTVQDLSFDDWQLLETIKDQRKYLLDAYVERMLNRTIKNHRYLKKKLSSLRINGWIAKLQWSLNKEPQREEIKHWLIFLAQQLQKRSSTDFLIEEMQLDWLPKSYKKYQKIISGLIAGLTYFFLASFLSEFLINSAFSSVLNNPTARVSLGAFKIVNIFSSLSLASVFFMSEKDAKMSLKPSKDRMIFQTKTYLFSFCSAPIIGWHLFNNSIFAGGPVNVRLLISIIFSMAIPLFSLMNFMVIGSISEIIQPVNKLIFSWKRAMGGFILISFIMIFIAPLVVPPFFCFFLQSSCTVESKRVYYNILISVILPALLVIFIPFSGICFRSVVQISKYPNEGIKNSLTNSFSVLLLSFFYLVLIVPSAYNFMSFIKNVDNYNILDFNNVKFGVNFGFLAGGTLGVPLSFRFGGRACLQHFSLRLLLWHQNSIPRNYARFLSYATERRFLEQVGGRYKFIHRLIQDHFATMSLDSNKF